MSKARQDIDTEQIEAIVFQLEGANIPTLQELYRLLEAAVMDASADEHQLTVARQGDIHHTGGAQ